MESKGRGRGGVPLLPEGMWDALNRGDAKRDDELEDSLKDLAANADDNSGVDVPLSFGGKSHSGRGFGAGRGMGRGRGLQRDAKGTDWDCPSCGNVNWSWRSTCNKCNGAKPSSILSENEIRDGAGGGFNERQERVSAASVEVDEDGFDDFGRRIKRGKIDRSAKEAAALARLQQSYGFLTGDFGSNDLDSVPSASTKSAAPSTSGQFDDADERRSTARSANDVNRKDEIGNRGTGSKDLDSHRQSSSNARRDSRDMDANRPSYVKSDGAKKLDRQSDIGKSRRSSSRSRHRSRSRSNDRSRAKDSRGGRRDRSTSRDGRDRNRDRSRERTGDKDKHRDRDSRRDMDREYEKGHHRSRGF